MGPNALFNPAASRRGSTWLMFRRMSVRSAPAAPATPAPCPLTSATSSREMSPEAQLER